jgi:alpha-L-rhamnosidase
MKKHSTLIILFFILWMFPSLTYSQPSRPWNAQWIGVAGDPGTEYGVFYFRKSIQLSSQPTTFKVHVSGDNRYKLYVNGTLVSLGPARGDLYYWNYETVDLAPYLKAGNNVVAALVFNEAQYRPEAQITLRTGFILQGDTQAEEILNTNNSWKGMQDKSRQPTPGFEFAASKGELVDMNLAINDWNTPGFDDSKWAAAGQLGQGQLKGSNDGFGWDLVPSSLPQMEMTYQRIPQVRLANGVKVPDGFPGTTKSITIPANTTATLLLDQTYETNAYITCNFSSGKDASIVMRFAEALYEKDRSKGNRDSIAGKRFSGRMDSLISNGQNGQNFTTLYWRSFRYMQLTVHTKDEPLTINDLYGTFTGFPFKQQAVLNTDSAVMNKILDIGWRTARLCAMETYFDCPYYEQLQYIGDSRIQAMVSYYNAGNDTLARNALNLMDHSRLSEGVTMSRWPTHSTQIISTFSLFYIGMLHDYWMYRSDSVFIKNKLMGMRNILDFFSKFQQADGSISNLPYWTFVDWAGGNNWGWGAPPKGADGSSAEFDLQLLWAYEWAAEMETSLGMPAFAAQYRSKAAQLKATIRKKYWNAAKQMFAETKEQNTYSQHTNALAILTGVATDKEAPGLGKRILADNSLTQCSIYFKYYLHMALVKAGMGDDYMSWLDVWRGDINMGLTTWAEEPDANTSRSDCHAWGSSPNIEFYRTVLGIDSDAPGFRKVKITPHLGKITNISGTIPHPNGNVGAAYTLKNGKWDIKLDLPAKTTGTFVWKGKAYPLKSGANTFTL